MRAVEAMAEGTSLKQLLPLMSYTVLFNSHSNRRFKPSIVNMPFIPAEFLLLVSSMGPLVCCDKIHSQRFACQACANEKAYTFIISNAKDHNLITID